MQSKGLGSPGNLSGLPWYNEPPNLSDTLTTILFCSCGSRIRTENRDVCLSSVTFEPSSGNTGVAEGDSNDLDLESSGSFFTEITGT